MKVKVRKVNKTSNELQLKSAFENMTQLWSAADSKRFQLQKENAELKSELQDRDARINELEAQLDFLKAK